MWLKAQMRKSIKGGSMKIDASAIAALRGVEREREADPSFGPVRLNAADEASGLASCFVNLIPS